MIRSHLRSRCTHSTQRSKSVSTWHFMKRLEQWLQRHITELSLWRSFFERRQRFATELDGLNTQFKYIRMMISENRNLEENLVLEHSSSWDRNYNEWDVVHSIMNSELVRSWSRANDSLYEIIEIIKWFSWFRIWVDEVTQRLRRSHESSLSI